MRLFELGSDLQTLWSHPASKDDLKKRVLRSVLVEVMIGDDEEKKTHQLVLHWKGGSHTQLSVLRRKSGKKYTDTGTIALELVEELSKVCNDQGIAATLNRLGIKTGAGNRGVFTVFTAHVTTIG